MLTVDQLHLLLLLQSQLLVLLQVVLMLLLLLLQVLQTVQVIGLIGTRIYWESSRIHTDFRLGLVVARLRARVPQTLLASCSVPHNKLAEITPRPKSPSIALSQHRSLYSVHFPKQKRGFFSSFFRDKFACF